METEGYSNNIISQYGHRIRVRASGILVVGNSILAIGHQMKRHSDRLFWAPPGGGLEFGERMVQAVKREFLEETGLQVTVGELLSVCEFTAEPLHAVELFFRITHFEGDIKVGQDPEHDVQGQSIRKVAFMEISELNRMSPNEAHDVLRKFKSFEESGPWQGLLDF